MALVHSMKNIIPVVSNFLRKRYAVPLIVVATVVALLVNEVAYWRTAQILRSGIELTDARIGTARVLQLLTDAESGQRGYILTDQAAFLPPYRKALSELPVQRSQLRRYFSTTESDAGPLVKKADEIIDSKLLELASVLELEQRGQHDAAVGLITSGKGRALMDELREVFTTELDQAAQAQAQTRVSIYDTLQFNRIVAATLILAGSVGLLVYLRQLRIHDSGRAAREASLEKLVRTRTRELRHLARHLQTVREDERGYLAREIHDELGGLLTAAKLDLARMRAKMISEPPLLERIEHAIELLNQGIAFKRRVIEDLKPSSLEILGVRIAVLHLCEEAEKTMGIPVQTELEDVQLAPPDDLVVYRFVQEALTNVAKYARAKRVGVRLAYESERVEIEVRDDGVGFAQKVAMPGHHGLAGMRFRVESIGGAMTIESAPGEGTCLRARLPRVASDPAETERGSL